MHVRTCGFLLVPLFLFLSLLLYNVAVGVYETESGVFRLISDGDLPSAVAASCAIPYIFQPVQGTLHIGIVTVIGMIIGGSITIFDLSLSESLSLSILSVMKHSPLIIIGHFLLSLCSSFHDIVSLCDDNNDYDDDVAGNPPVFMADGGFKDRLGAHTYTHTYIYTHTHTHTHTHTFTYVQILFLTCFSSYVFIISVVAISYPHFFFILSYLLFLTFFTSLQVLYGVLTSIPNLLRSSASFVCITSLFYPPHLSTRTSLPFLLFYSPFLFLSFSLLSSSFLCRYPSMGRVVRSI